MTIGYLSGYFGEGTEEIKILDCRFLKKENKAGSVFIIYTHIQD
jgi:hypothetical protein